MARRLIQLTSVIFILCVTCPYRVIAANSTTGGDTPEFSVATMSVGGEFFAYGQLTVKRLSGTKTYSLPTGHRYVNCYYSAWHHLRKLPNGWRRYDVVIWDACLNQQVFPGGSAHCTQGLDYQGDANPSECVDLPPRTVPAGYDPASCGALAETSSHMSATVTPAKYDIGAGANLTATTLFDKDFASSLSDGTCTSLISWNTLSWRLTWADGTVLNQPGSSHSGITTSHQIPPVPNSNGTQVSSVTAIAHIHIQGIGVGFNAFGNPTRSPVDTFVDVSNIASSSGFGSAPTYLPPVLSIGGIGESQSGTGLFPSFIPTGTPTIHLTAIRGHLLSIFPRAVVQTSGTEVVDGVVIGTSTTTTVGWTFLGGATSAPYSQATPPGSTGGPLESINVQWNNAERLDSLGRPIDERVPVSVTCQTIYPDGHIETTVLSGSIPVTIYYVASTTQN